MRVARIPLQPRHSKRLSQHCLPQCRSREGRGVETREGVEGISFHVRACNSRIQESKVKRSVVTDENRAAAVVRVNRMANLTEYPTERIFLRQRWTQGVEGINTGDRQRRWIESGAFEWFDVKAVCCTAFQRAVWFHVDEHCCDFQLRIRG